MNGPEHPDVVGARALIKAASSDERALCQHLSARLGYARDANRRGQAQ